MKKRPHPSTLVLNMAAATLTTNQLQTLTFNAEMDLVRNDTMAGRPYIVVPMVMAVVGVLNGSLGALYYPEEELAKTPAVWNHKPIVVDHPTFNGQGISACDPKVVTERSIGVIMNTVFEPGVDGKPGRLKAEAWIEEDRARAVDPRVMVAINKRTPMELSTGLFTDNEASAGEFNGKPYTMIARNYRPDHLAVLPDSTGASSIADGAGFVRNQLKTNLPKEDAARLERLVQRTLADITANVDVSFDAVRSLLQTALREKLPTKMSDVGMGNDIPCYCYVEAVYPTFVVYEYQNKLWKLDYTISAAGTSVTLTGVPIEVVRTIQFRTVDGAIVGNSSTTPVTNNTRPTMNKKAIIDGLIANAASGWTEANRAFLEGVSEEQLTVINTNAIKASTAPKEIVKEVPATLKPEDSEALAYGRRQLAANKATVTAKIVAFPLNKFTAEQLAAKSIEELEQIASFCVTPAIANNGGVDYSGNGGQAPKITENQAQVLDAPSMDFGKA